jgi:hypothetical protein
VLNTQLGLIGGFLASKLLSKYRFADFVSSGYVKVAQNAPIS